MLGRMKKTQPATVVMAPQNGGSQATLLHGERKILYTKETTWAFRAAQETGKRQVPRYPTSQLNKDQHGVWV